jgi:hypothetical protein
VDNDAATSRLPQCPLPATPISSGGRTRRRPDPVPHRRSGARRARCGAEEQRRWEASAEEPSGPRVAYRRAPPRRVRIGWSAPLSLRLPLSRSGALGVHDDERVADGERRHRPRQRSQAWSCAPTAGHQCVAAATTSALPTGSDATGRGGGVGRGAVHQWLGAGVSRPRW